MHFGVQKCLFFNPPPRIKSIPPNHAGIWHDGWRHRHDDPPIMPSCHLNEQSGSNRNLELINPPQIEFAPKIKFGPDPEKTARIEFAPKIKFGARG